MSKVRPGGSDGQASGRNTAARRAADVLALAASPTFAIMALQSGLLGGNSVDMVCSAAHASPLSGMVTMYLLMSAFHAAPWLRLLRESPQAGLRVRHRPQRKFAMKSGGE